MTEDAEDTEEQAEVSEYQKSVLRAPDGKWLRGTPSPNPSGQPRKEQHYIDLIHKTVTDEDAIAIIKKAVAQAKQGNRWARKFLWEYLVGKPRPMPGGGGREAPMLALLKVWIAQALPGIGEAGGEMRALAAELRTTLPGNVELGDE